MHEFLRQVPIFAELGDEELRLLAEAAVEHHVQQNSTIVHKDEPGTSLFIVRSGAVDVISESLHSHPIHLATFRTGEFFGEMALFDGKPRSATVIAQEDTTVIEISRESFIKLALRHTDVALKIMAEIASRVRQTDELVKEYSERIYREAYMSVEKVLRAELESAKIIYGHIEKTALTTVDHVERSWKTLSRIIVIILGVVTAIGSGLAILGYSGYKDIQNKTEEVRDMRNASKGYVSEIAQLRESAHANKLLREVMLELRKIREDLSLPKDLERMSLEELWTGTVLYTPARQTLFKYITAPEDYEPEAVLEAIGLLLELARQDKLPLNQEVYHRIHEALLHVAVKNPKDWRIRMRVRDQVVGLGKLVQDRRFIDQYVVHDWRVILAQTDVEPRLREDAAVISASIGGQGDDIQRVLLETMQDAKKTFWRRYGAAMALIAMGNDKGLNYLVNQPQRSNQESLWADIHLGMLGKDELTRLATITSHGNSITPQTVSGRILQKIEDIHRIENGQNALLKAYAEKMARCLVASEAGCM
jgi:CRP-like cAMP-binding protein